MHFLFSNSILCYLLTSLVVIPLLTTWDHDISLCNCYPLVVFTIWTSGSSDPSKYFDSFMHYCCWVCTTTTSLSPPSCLDKLSLWTSDKSWRKFAFVSIFRVFVSNTCSSACVQRKTPIVYQRTGMLYAPIDVMVFLAIIDDLSITCSLSLYFFCTSSLTYFSGIISQTNIPR